MTLADRWDKLPKWARDHIQELTYLRDQNRQLIKLVGELKAGNRTLRKRLERMTP